MEPSEKRLAGWREWLSLPGLGVGEIKAKLDTGARTSALHAFDIEVFSRRNVRWVRFNLHPLQRDDTFSLACEALITDTRGVTNSGGKTEERYFIETLIRIGGIEWPIEIGLTNRDEMGFRMLLGRSALKDHIIVDPARSFRIGKRMRKAKKLKSKKNL